MGRSHNTGFLNGLRALSALWVLTAHCMIWGGYDGFIPNAKLAVAIFMVLSGYLMALTARDFTRPAEWARFYLKRFFRLAPLYYLVLALVAVSPWVREGFAAWHRFDPGSTYDPARADFSVRNLALHASFVFGLFRGANSSTLLPDWSLSLEMQFYAAFPAIWLAMRRWGGLRVGAVLGVLSLIFWSANRSTWADPSPLPLQLPYFLAGILAFEARTSAPLAALALLLGAFEVPYLGLEALVVPFTVGTILLLDRRRLPLFSRALDNRAMTVAADLSYAIYLIHGPMIAAAGILALPRVWLWPFVLATSGLLSFALHWTVERPAIALGAQLQSPGAPIPPPVGESR